MMNSREGRLSSWSNATCAMPLCEALSSRRGRGPHHAQIDRVGTWDISGPTAGSVYCHEYGGPEREGEEPYRMMHGHEKSASAIEAVKPTNKALPSAAEQSTAELFAA